METIVESYVRRLHKNAKAWQSYEVCKVSVKVERAGNHNR